VSSTDALELARRVADRQPGAIVYTDISRDGMLSGPNVDAMRRMVEAVPSVPIIASGGVGKLEDVLSLVRTGAVGAILGTSIYTGAVDLAEAIERVAALEAEGSVGGC